MKKTLLLCSILFLIAINNYAQHIKLDSLLILLKTDRADTNRLIHLYELSNEFSKIDNYDDGIKYANQAIIFSNVLPGKRDKTIKKTIKIYTAKTYYNLGNINYYKSNYQEAVKNAELIISEWLETARDLGRIIPESKGRLLFA